MDFHKIIIKDVTRLTKKSVQLTFDIPAALKEDFQYHAGQYLTFEFTVGNDKIRRDYSLCSAPFEDKWAIGVKATDNGLVSKHLNKNVHTGDYLFVSKPHGKFGISNHLENNKLFLAFAGGSGVTPILSIVKQTLHAQPGIFVHFFYANNDKEDTMFYDDIKSLEKKYPNTLKVHYFFANEQTPDPFYHGIITHEKVNYILNHIVQINDVSEAFICGPEPMMVGVANSLFKNGLSKDKIKFELFAPPSQPLFEEAATQAEQINSTTPPIDGEITIQYTMDDEVHTVKLKDNGKSILDQLLDADIDAPYSCKGGVCSSCITKIITGEVDFNKSKNFVLTDSEISDGFILCCQSKPKSAFLEIDFDDTP